TLEDNYYNEDNTKRCSTHYKFFFKELFIYIITIAFLKDKFELISYLINTPYYIKNSTNEKGNRNFTFLHSYLDVLDEQRKKRLKVNQKSLSTDLLVERIDY